MQWFDYKKVYDRIYNELQPESIFVEIGSFLGESTKYFCELIRKGDKPINFIQVDKFEYDEEYKDNLPKGWKGSFYPLFLENLKDYEDIITPYVMSSVEASKQLPNNLVGAVFIDAKHDYKSVSEDIWSWTKKVKAGGIISGHDIDFPTVWRAVKENFSQVIIIGRSWLTYKQFYVE